MSLQELILYCKERAKEFPKLESDIIDLLVLAESEIEKGSSVAHECELAVNSIKELIESQK